jgi:hypothetical protein
VTGGWSGELRRAGRSRFAIRVAFWATTCHGA